MIKYTKQELQELKLLTDKLRELEQRKVYPLTPKLLEQLVNRALNYNDINDIFNEPIFSACGCIGARHGELYCNCAMSHCRYEYRYDVALFIIDNMDFEMKPIQAPTEQLFHQKNTI